MAWQEQQPAEYWTLLTPKQHVLTKTHMRNVLISLLLALPSIAFAQTTVSGKSTEISIKNKNSSALLVCDGVSDWMLVAGISAPTPPTTPSITSLSPIGQVGSDVTIHGHSFGSSATGNSVTFNGLRAMTKSWSETQIVATVPIGASNGNVVVTTNDGGSSAGSPFTVGAPPPVVYLTPASSTSFPPTNRNGNTNNGLLPNGGAANGTGAFGWPSTPTDSFAIYNEFQAGQTGGRLFGFVNSNVGLAYGVTVGATVGVGSAPSLFVQTPLNNFPWWLATVGVQGIGLFSNPVSFNPKGSGYNNGIFTWKAGDGCPPANGEGAREPMGALTTLNGYVNTVDYGFLCGDNANALGPKVEVDRIPGLGGNQRTGPPSTPASAATTCVGK